STVGADRAGNAQIVDGGAIPDGRIVQADRGRYAVAEHRHVLDVVRPAVIATVATQQERIDIARSPLPGGCVGGSRLAEGESRKLDEQIIDSDVAATRGVKEGAVDACRKGRGCSGRRIEVTGIVELEFGRTEGADHAVFGGGAGIDR